MAKKGSKRERASKNPLRSEKGEGGTKREEHGSEAKDRQKKKQGSRVKGGTERQHNKGTCGQPGSKEKQV